MQPFDNRHHSVEKRAPVKPSQVIEWDFEALDEFNKRCILEHIASWEKDIVAEQEQVCEIGVSEDTAKNAGAIR